MCQEEIRILVAQVDNTIQRRNKVFQTECLICQRHINLRTLNKIVVLPSVAHLLHENQFRFLNGVYCDKAVPKYCYLAIMNF